jgi:hypothetical protein
MRYLEYIVDNYVAFAFVFIALALGIMLIIESRVDASRPCVERNSSGIEHAFFRCLTNDKLKYNVQRPEMCKNIARALYCP